MMMYSDYQIILNLSFFLHYKRYPVVKDNKKRGASRWSTAGLCFKL